MSAGAMANDMMFENVESLIDHLNTINASGAIDQVAAKVEEILKKHIASDIYGRSYKSEGAWVNGTTYQNRNNIENMVKSEMEDENTLVVTSTEGASESISRIKKFSNGEDGAFLQLLESGNMGFVKKGFSRPAVTNAQREVDNNPSIRALIDRGMKEKYL